MNKKSTWSNIFSALLFCCDILARFHVNSVLALHYYDTEMTIDILKQHDLLLYSVYVLYYK